MKIKKKKKEKKIENEVGTFETHRNVFKMKQKNG